MERRINYNKIEPTSEECSLIALFLQINIDHFESVLTPPLLVWNSRLRSSAGRFSPGHESLFSSERPKIEVASYLLEEKDADELVWDTLAHEMIHYWLWFLGRPYGHTKEFLIKMREMGVSRYNPVPRRTQAKYLYRCPHCRMEYPFRKRVRERACGECCKKYSGNRFDIRFKLKLDRKPS